MSGRFRPAPLSCQRGAGRNLPMWMATSPRAPSRRAASGERRPELEDRPWCPNKGRRFLDITDSGRERWSPYPSRWKAARLQLEAVRVGSRGASDGGGHDRTSTGISTVVGDNGAHSAPYGLLSSVFRFPTPAADGSAGTDFRYSAIALRSSAVRWLVLSSMTLDMASPAKSPSGSIPVCRK